jgi:hypothetical protein
LYCHPRFAQAEVAQLWGKTISLVHAAQRTHTHPMQRPAVDARRDNLHVTQLCGTHFRRGTFGIPAFRKRSDLQV